MHCKLPADQYLFHHVEGDPVKVQVDASVMSFGKLDTLNMVRHQNSYSLKLVKFDFFLG